MTVATFPTFPGLTFPIRRTPIWRTVRQDSVGGQSPRFAQWSYPRWRYEVPLEVLRTHGSYTEMQSLIGFVNGLAGAAGTFTYADPYDGTVTAQNFGTGDGSDTTFQLVRTLGSFTEPVYAPTGTPSIYVNAVLKTVTTDYTIGSTGIVTFTSAPAAAAALTWTGAFSWLCQLDEDETELQQDDSYRWSVGSLKFTTIKL